MGNLPEIVVRRLIEAENSFTKLGRYYAQFVDGHEEDFGSVFSHRGSGYVLFDDCYRGGVTQFFTTDGTDLYYSGEDPSEPSGGQALGSPWDEAERLEGEVYPTGRRNDALAQAASKKFGDVALYDFGDEDYEDEDRE